MKSALVSPAAVLVVVVEPLMVKETGCPCSGPSVATVSTVTRRTVPFGSSSVTSKEALPARVERTVPRDRLWAMQTPQVMRREALREAFTRCPIPLEQVTDDVQLLELAGHAVWLVAGEERNLKITTPMDLKLAELLLKADGGRQKAE